MKIWLMLDICANFWGFWVNYIFLNILVSFTFLQKYKNNKNWKKMLKKVPKAKNYPEMGSKFLDMYILVVFKERKKIWDGTQKSRWVDVESPLCHTTVVCTTMPWSVPYCWGTLCIWKEF